MHLKNLTPFIAAALFAAVAPATQAQTLTVGGAKAQGAGAIVADARTTAVVESIDQTTRKVKLRGADGSVYSFTASPDVKNLAQVKAGDQVTLSHTVAVALELKKNGGATRTKTETEGAVRAKPGEAPAAAAAREIRVIADVVSIDQAKKTVRLRGPERTVDLKVEDPKQLADIKVGDQVEAVFIEAVAIAVDKAPAKK
ncbi:hypothetical protein [uncultured Ramlibacter sp.]|uniref:hypothetical protein n=1 Tax=uncultured Ramlibacter sp. TaxID=260755 RepID=UPI00261ACAFD|nr:hypothetical protein [uncultured Ramlibacter sp.]